MAEVTNGNCHDQTTGQRLWSPDEIVEYMEISMKPSPEKRLTAKECLAKFNCFKSEMEKELAFQKASVQALKDQLSSSVAAKSQLKRHHSVI